VNVFFFVCLYTWNLWMFCSSFIYMNGICECFLYCLFIWMEYVNVFIIVCLYEWNLWMFSLLFVYMNGICECFLYGLFIWIESVKVFFICKFIWIEHMCIFFIPCLNESNMWMFPLMLAYMCFSCGDLDSVQVAFIKIAQGFVALSKYRTYISFCLYCLYINLLVCQSKG
jgi:hypothetical protein